jgi:hypothetical protein
MAHVVCLSPSQAVPPVPAQSQPVEAAPAHQVPAASPQPPAPAQDAVVPQPVKQTTPMRVVAPPASANMTYAQRLKLNAAGTPTQSPLAQPTTAAFNAAPEAVEAAPAPQNQSHGDSNGVHAPRGRPQAPNMETSVYGIFIRDFPQVSALCSEGFRLK